MDTNSLTDVNCDILFDNEVKTYQSGQAVGVQVNLTFNTPAKCRCIYVKFIGEAIVKWTKRRHRGRGRRHSQEDLVTEFTAREDYFSINRDIIRSDDGSDIELQAKRYTNSISCTLPQNLPSSFQGQFGAIRYVLRVFIDMGRIEEINETEFKVYTPLDLNNFPHLRYPKTIEMSRDFCCWIWRHGPLNISAHVPYTGFVANQNIPITIECENGSNVDLNACKVYIKQIATFHCTDPKREIHTDEQQICETKLDGVQKHTTKQVHGVLTIPDIKSTNLTKCAIIEVKYVLKMKGVTTGANGNLFSEVPIILGTIPFTNFDYGQANSSQTRDTHNDQNRRTSETNQTAHVVDEKRGGPPPSYDDIVNTNSNVDIGWNSNMSSS